MVTTFHPSRASARATAAAIPILRLAPVTIAVLSVLRFAFTFTIEHFHDRALENAPPLTLFLATLPSKGRGWGLGCLRTALSREIVRYAQDAQKMGSSRGRRQRRTALPDLWAPMHATRNPGSLRSADSGRDDTKNWASEGLLRRRFRAQIF